MNRKVEKALVTVIVSEYDDQGRLVNEIAIENQGKPFVAYRATTPDVWTAAEAMLKLTKEATNGSDA